MSEQSPRPFDALPTAVARLSAGCELESMNAAMDSLRERLGSRGQELLSAACVAAEPGAETWVRLDEPAPPTVVRVTPGKPAANGDVLLVLQDATSEAAALAEQARVCAVRPLIPALVHELNNLLHVSMTVSDQLREQSTLSEDAALAQRTEASVRHMAQVLSSVRAFGAERRDTARRVRVSAVLDRAAALLGNYCLESGVQLEVRCDSGLENIQLEVEVADLLAAVSQLTGHALKTRGTDTRVQLEATERDGLVGLAVLCGGDFQADAGLEQLETQPTMRIGGRPIPEFFGDPTMLGGALVGLWLRAGGFRVWRTDDGLRHFFVGVPASSDAAPERRRAPRELL